MTDPTHHGVARSWTPQGFRTWSPTDLDVGRRLRVLTGVDEKLLAEVPHDRTRYTALGGVVLGTAAIATFSMFMALTETLGQASVLLTVPVLLWGLFVLNLDRLLVTSATGTRWGRRLALLLPRLVLAGFFGVIVAEPLVLRVFQTAIEQHVEQQRLDELGALRTALIACNPVPGQDKATVDPAGPYCHDHRLDISVDPAGDAAQLTADQNQANTLRTTVDTETSQQTTLTNDANAECSGAAGPGFTGRVGYGRQCMDRWAAANQYAATHPIAQQQQQLADLQATIAKLSTQVSTDQAAYQKELNDQINQKVAERRSQQGNIGLLERFQALDELISTNGFLFAARWTVSIFFILVDCLPVLAKLIGGITSYDRLVDRASTSAERVFDVKTRQREDELLADAEIRRYRSDARVRKERIETDVDLIRHRNEMERRIDEQTDMLTEQLIRKTRTRERREELTIPLKPLMTGP